MKGSSSRRPEAGHDVNNRTDDSYSQSTKSMIVTSNEANRNTTHPNSKYGGTHTDDDNISISRTNDIEPSHSDKELERQLVRKVDLRLCTIAGILCSLNLLDSGIISSASVTSIFDDLGLGVGNRYVSSVHSLFRMPVK